MDKITKLIVGSEKLFINTRNNYLNEFKYDHSIAILEDTNELHLSVDQIMKRTDDIITSGKVEYLWEDDLVTHRSFIGFGSDCYHAFDLASRYNVIFDAAVFINFDWTLLQNQNLDISHMVRETSMYNIYNKAKYKNTTDIVKVDELIDSKISPVHSKVFSQAVYSFIVYDTYKLNYCQGSPSILEMATGPDL